MAITKVKARGTDNNNLPVSSEENGPLNLFRPLLLMAYSTYYLFDTILHLIITFQFKPFFSISDFKDEWFARFWSFFGTMSRDNAAPAVMPLLQNHAKGVCLDIGPGSGMWVHLFGRANNPEITKIYGIEPNLSLHPMLKENARQAGLEGIYEVIGCGAEELQTKGGIQRESIDTIITVQCMCSIPTPELIIRELYPLLKPGGQWLLYEHIKTPFTSDFVAYWQKFINIVWPHMFNGCNITRPTDEWLEKAGEWEEINLQAGEGEGKYDTLPHSIGTLTKKK